MQPLEGITILAIEQYGAGPFGTMLLADLGARVIKVENPTMDGDISRNVGPFFFGPGDSGFFHTFNRNKESITLNLDCEEGQSIFRRLIPECDAVFNNLRGDLPAKFGLAYDDLKDLNPAIVCGHLSAFGRSGSRAAWPGYDYLMQAEAGYFSLTGEPGGPPARFGLSVVDYMTGVLGALGLASALIGARQSGQGQDIDVSLFDTALQNLSYLATWHLNFDHTPGRAPRSAHPSLGPTQLCATANGWVFIMCNKQKFWEVLARHLGKPEWCDDPRFRSFSDRLKNRDELTQLLDEQFSTRTTDEWLKIMGGSVPIAPVFDVPTALSNDFAVERETVAEFERREEGAPVKMLTSPFRTKEAMPQTAGPPLGFDNRTVYASIGIDLEEQARLISAGVI